MCSKEQWDAIRMEYVTTAIGYRPLSEKHGVSFSTISKRAIREDWTRQRDEYRYSVDTKLAQKLEVLADKQAESVVGSREWVKQSLIEVARRCMEPDRVMVRVGKDWVQATDDDGNLVFKFDSAGANRALELIGKSADVAMFVDRTELTGKDGGPIQTTQVEDLTPYTDDELKQMRAIHETANARRDQQGTGRT